MELIATQDDDDPTRQERTTTLGVAWSLVSPPTRFHQLVSSKGAIGNSEVASIFM